MKLVHVYDTPQERRAVKRANEIRDQLTQLERTRDRHILKMADEIGLPTRAIAAEVGLGTGTVHRTLTRMRSEQEGSA